MPLRSKPQIELRNLRSRSPWRLRLRRPIGQFSVIIVPSERLKYLTQISLPNSDERKASRQNLGGYTLNGEQPVRLSRRLCNSSWICCESKWLRRGASGACSLCFWNDFRVLWTKVLRFALALCPALPIKRRHSPSFCSGIQHPVFKSCPTGFPATG